MKTTRIIRKKETASFPVIKLKPNITHRVLKKHLWIYKTEIEDYETLDIEGGSIVNVLDSKGNFIGCGFYSSSSEIAVRLFSFNAITPDKNFWRALIQKAIDYRQRIVPSWTSKRLINSESDFFPGLIVDQYGEMLVFQTLIQGTERIKNDIIDSLVEILKPHTIIEQNNSSTRKIEKLTQKIEIIYGKLPENTSIKIGSIVYNFRGTLPHKTAFYLDQQSNYAIVAKFIKDGMRVLDLFSYAGAFALHALINGAAEVIAVDIASEPLKIAKATALKLGLGDKLHIVQENAFDFLHSAIEQKEKFDFIILDPPSFTRTKRHIKEARRGYKELHLKAFKLLKENGKLATFCCSHHISTTMFRDYINEAAYDVGIVLRRETLLTQSPDHPVIHSVPETEYLKGFIFDFPQV